MRRRLMTLLRPEIADRLSSPRTAEAIAAWLLGTVWVLLCLWLGHFEIEALAPAALVAGLIALWGWRHDRWLLWLPAVAIVSSMLDLVSPLPAIGFFGRLLYVDLVVVGALIISVARAVGLKRRPWPGTPLDRLILALVLLCLIAVIPTRGRPDTQLALKQVVASVAVFYGTTALATRPGGARWAWPAFPATAAALGLHALWASSHGADELRRHAELADRLWLGHGGLRNALLVAVPVSVGLALDAGSGVARLAWRAASFLGVIGLVLHLRLGGFPLGGFGLARLNDPLLFSASIVSSVSLLVLTRNAWQARLSRPRERVRWLALAGTLAAAALLEPLSGMLSGQTTQLLIAVGAGTATGAMRSRRMAERAGKGPGRKDAAVEAETKEVAA